MKRILSFITLFALLLTSCEGDPGPPGPPGFNGLDGLDADAFAARTYEPPQPIDFEFDNESGLQLAYIDLPTSEFEILESDAVLVYRWEGEVELTDGSFADTWALLPHNFFLNDNQIFQYVYNHTFVDVELIIDGNFDLSTLDTGFTQNQRFRVIIVPSIALNGVDISNLDNVIQTFNIESF